MLFTEDQDMIQALATERPDQAFNIWVLPGRSGGRESPDAWADYEIFLIDAGATDKEIAAERARNSTEHVARRCHALNKVRALVGDERGDEILH
jgi:hypothetical protein